MDDPLQWFLHEQLQKKKSGWIDHSFCAREADRCAVLASFVGKSMNLAQLQALRALWFPNARVGFLVGGDRIEEASRSPIRIISPFGI
jgi:hypothetical protein